MLKEILSPSSCAGCRLCCGFDESDLWEIPVFSADTSERLEKERPELTLLPYGTGSRVLQMHFDGDGIARCPALTENGCTLGENKPFDCRIWPFRVMEQNGKTVLTLAPICESVQKIERERLAAFAKKISPLIREEIRKNPDIIKPYRDGYQVMGGLD